MIERTAIDAYTHGFFVLHSNLANGFKIFIAALTGPHITGVDAVFVQRLSTGRVLAQENVTVVMKIPNQGLLTTGRQHPLLNAFHLGRSSFIIDRNTH